MTIDTGDAIAHSLCFDKSSKYIAVGCSDAEIKMINLSGVKALADGIAVSASLTQVLAFG